MRFCGMSLDGILPEIIEYADHPWFIGVQFHPELKSRPFEPHPLFSSFIGAAVEQSRLVQYPRCGEGSTMSFMSGTVSMQRRICTVDLASQSARAIVTLGARTITSFNFRASSLSC